MRSPNGQVEPPDGGLRLNCALLDGAHRRPSGTAGPDPRLTITASSVGPGWELVFRGSLDAGSVVALHSQFDQLVSGEFDHVIVDVSQLAVIDDVGAAALGALEERVAVAGAELLRHGINTAVPGQW